MFAAESPSSFARLSPLSARLLLAVAALTGVVLVGLTLSPLERGYAGQQRIGQGDVALYCAEIDAMHSGLGYYDAAERELRARAYPTRSVFNWRAPLPVGLTGALPAPQIAQGLLASLGFLLMLAAFELLAREAGVRTALLGAALLTGPLMFCVLGDIYCMPEIWAGVLLTLSICAYGLGQWKGGLAAGLGAIFVRELAAPYCLLCVVLAAKERRWREVSLWLLGGLAYTAYYAWHLTNVLPRISAGDLAHQASWLQFGGATQVIALAQVNGYLLLLPQGFAALFLTLALIGFASWSTPAGERAGLTTSLYVVGFALVGHEFNQYWGAVFGPLLCLGAALAPRALRDLFSAVRRPSRVQAGCAG
ncbi:MAG: hypothetical protein U0836_09475 [Pirellulales bacterium]